MIGLSILEKNQRIFQIYCGRWQQANAIDHPGKVLSRMLNFNWLKMKAELGLSTIYLLGLWDVTGPIVVQEEEGMDLNQKHNRCPSAFAISDHNQVWPVLGTNEDLVKLIDGIHKAGLKVIVDLVANHTATNHRWVNLYPEIYKSCKGAFSGDVYELNYESVVTVKLMEETVLNLVQMGVDGFRCDMAHLVPGFFWKQVIDHSRRLNQEVWFMAESYEDSIFCHQNRDELLDSGFSAIYDSGLYQNLRMMRESKDVSGLVAHLNYVNKFEPKTWIHYFANHDDSFPLPPELIEVTAALLACLNGNWLIFNGSLSGQNHRLAHHFIDILGEDKTGSLIASPKLHNWLVSRQELGPIKTVFIASGLKILAGDCWFDFESGTYGS